MNATQINDQFTIHIEPEVVVSGEFEDNIMTPCIQTTRCLLKGCFQFHAEIVIRILYQIQLLIFSGIVFIQLMFAINLVKILPVLL